MDSPACRGLPEHARDSSMGGNGIPPYELSAPIRRSGMRGWRRFPCRRAKAQGRNIAVMLLPLGNPCPAMPRPY